MIQPICDSKNEEGEKNTLEDSVSDLMENTLLKLEEGCEFVASPDLANIVYHKPNHDEDNLPSDNHGGNLDWMPQATFGAPNKSSGDNLIAVGTTTSNFFDPNREKEEPLHTQKTASFNNSGQVSFRDSRPGNLDHSPL